MVCQSKTNYENLERTDILVFTLDFSRPPQQETNDVGFLQDELESQLDSLHKIYYVSDRHYVRLFRNFST